MRTLAALLSWLITTATLAVAVPTAWAQRNLVDANGFAALTQRAAEDPVLKSAVAGELTTHMVQLIRANGYDVYPALVRDVAAAYTAGSSFPPQFAQASLVAHRWLFTDEGNGDWVIDLAPMLDDSAFQPMLGDYHVQPPSGLTVPLTAGASEPLRAGQLRPLADWGPSVILGAAVLTGVGALLTLIAAHRRGKALSWLGVSALLAGAGGWVGIEVGRRYLNEALNATVGDTRRIADVVVAEAVHSLHGWLNLALAAGGVLVVCGVLVATLGGLRKS